MRYDVSIKTTITHMVAVEAEDVLHAQDVAMSMMAEKSADKMETFIEVEVGNG